MRSLFIAAVLAVVAVGSGVLSWYAWTESQSLPWATGYGVCAALAATGAVLCGRRAVTSDKRPDR